MQMILLILIAIVFLAGITAFVVGRKGWNAGTVVAGVLVLLVALGFTFLAGMVAQRERAWRAIVANYQAAIAKERDGLVPVAGGRLNQSPDLKSLAALKQDKARWERIRHRVDEWGGRAWPTASFTPPSDARPGTITIEDVEKLTLNAGSEIYVFDKADVADEGRFLGAFRVDGVNGNVVSVSAAVPSTADDKALWAKPREAVTVYESLPADSWLAFHRTATKPGEAAAADDEGAEGEAENAFPAPQKIDPEDLLKHLETRLAEVRQHAEPVAEEKWPELLEELKNDTTKTGRYWAQVEFKKPYSSERLPGDTREPIECESGQTGSFDLETAQKLKDDEIVDIISVESRRPLADAQAVLRGGEHTLSPTDGNGAGAKVQIEGIAFIRRMLDADIADIDAMTKRLQTAKSSADNQLGIHTKESEELADDLRSWQADVEAAGQTAERFEKRVAKLATELSGVESAVVELGRELDGASALLAGEIDLRAPPPARGGAPLAPVGRRLP